MWGTYFFNTVCILRERFCRDAIVNNEYNLGLLSSIFHFLFPSIFSALRVLLSKASHSVSLVHHAFQNLFLYDQQIRTPPQLSWIVSTHFLLQSNCLFTTCSLDTFSPVLIGLSRGLNTLVSFSMYDNPVAFNETLASFQYGMQLHLPHIFNMPCNLYSKWIASSLIPDSVATLTFDIFCFSCEKRSNPLFQTHHTTFKENYHTALISEIPLLLI